MTRISDPIFVEKLNHSIALLEILKNKQTKPQEGAKKNCNNCRRCISKNKDKNKNLNHDAREAGEIVNK